MAGSVATYAPRKKPETGERGGRGPDCPQLAAQAIVACRKPVAVVFVAQPPQPQTNVVSLRVADNGDDIAGDRRPAPGVSANPRRLLANQHVDEGGHSTPAHAKFRRATLHDIAHAVGKSPAIHRFRFRPGGTMRRRGTMRPRQGGSPDDIRDLLGKAGDTADLRAAERLLKTVHSSSF